ncbi:MAG: CPBP family intramembrane glutamic endopeptidase [Methanobacterium sp.]
MVTITDSIRKRPIAAFIILTFVLSYLVWAIIPLASIKNPVYQTLISIIGAYFIAISAIIVSRVLNPEPTGINQIKRLGIFVILFFVILPFALYNPYLQINLSDSVAIALCAIISALSAFVLSSVLSKNTGARELMVSVARWKINLVWYAIALLTWPIIYCICNITDLIFTGQPISLLTAQIMTINPIYLIIMFFSTLLVTTSVAEETGWRGFLLPMLQSRYSPLIASIIVLFIWEPWHIGLYFTGLYPFDIMTIIMDRIIPLTIGGVILYTWLYNRTGRNLFMIFLFHASANTTAAFIPTGKGIGLGVFYLITFILAIIVIYTDKMWKHLPMQQNTTS